MAQHERPRAGSPATAAIAVFHGIFSSRLPPRQSVRLTAGAVRPTHHCMHEVWSRVREGKHVVVVGNPPAPPEAGEGEPRWVVVRVGCDGPWSTWGPLEDARRRIEALLGEQSPRWDEALDRMGSSARLLGDLPEPTVEAMLVGVANRLAERHPGQAALVIEGLDTADEATVQALRDILGREGWLRLPLVLGVHAASNQGLLVELFESIPGMPVVMDAPAEAAPTFDWLTLGTEVLLVLRAAAVVGRTFEVELVARLLGVSADAVLVRLQQAADLGAPLADHGGGRFFIPEEAQAALVKRVLPSLVERWHRRLGEILAAPPLPLADADVDEPRTDSPRATAAPATRRTDVPTGAPAAGDAAVLDADDDLAADDDFAADDMELLPTNVPIGAPTPVSVAVPASADATVPAASQAVSADATMPPPSRVAPPADHEPDPSETLVYGEIFEPAPEERLSSRRAPPPSATMRAPEPAPGLDPGASSATMTMRLDPEEQERLLGARDQARAAHHLSEAGLPERAVEQYLAALRKVAARGDSRRALLIAEQALALLDRQPPSRALDVLHARVLAMAARVQWRGAGRGPALSLQGALESLDHAEQLVGADGPLDLRTEIAQLVAGVCYDLGDISSLQRALDALTDAARALMAAGEAVLAARLLNDQAAVYLRAGDPVRANHLLQQSRSVFDELHRERPDDPTVIVERAETEHLLARLPLHARLRPGREDDAYSLALGHARAAAEGYQRLGGRVELGRVIETMGRLETARGRHDRAAQHLDLSLRTSRELGDMIGLARSTAALAELYIVAGRPAEALGALRESVAFNVDKGSPLGLAVNRRTLESLRRAFVDDPQKAPALALAIREVEEALGRAEAMLGRVSVPGDAD